MRTLAVSCLIAAGAQAGEAPQIQPHQVLAVQHGDWNGDGSMDRALLVESAEDADLLIYLSGPDELALAIHRPALVWRGQMAGTLPELELAENGALRVISQNASIGRNRWREVLTVLYRDEAFIVGGYTYEAVDTLQPDSATHCDINLFNGKGFVNGAPVRVSARTRRVSQWSSDGICP
ncbi:MAG: hypothetical protein AAF415_18410 [Pseudomonadota bacterium]